jgi:hypothetical protein
MQGSWNNGQPYYRCTFPGEYALANRIDHPRVVYLREAEVVPELDTWLTRTLDPAHLPATLDALARPSTTILFPGNSASAGRSTSASGSSPSTGPPWTPAAIPQSSAHGSQRHKPGSWPPKRACVPNAKPALPHLGR